MTLLSSLSFAAAVFSLLLAVLSLVRSKPSFATWCFFAGMAALGIDSLFTGLTLREIDPSQVLDRLTLGLVMKSFVPAAWLAFSLAYSRGDYRQVLARWKIPLVLATLLPIALSLGFRQQLLFVPEDEGGAAQVRLSAMGKFLNVSLLLAFVWIVTNLEQTFRAAVGSSRWRIKFVVLGLAVVFGGRIYVRSQALLFSAYDRNWSGIEASALLIGCVFLVVAYARTGFAEIDVYPSRAVLRSSLTVLLVGGYLFAVGILANIVSRFGGAESFQFQVFVVLLGVAGLAALLASDRLRQRIHIFINRHFARAQHDSVRIWSEFSRRLAGVKNQSDLCAASARLVSETFEVLSVTVWLLDEQNEQLVTGASTATQPGEAIASDPRAATSSAVAAGLRPRASPFDLERVNEPWAEELRRLNPSVFPNGGDRWCVPLRAREQSLGALVLADRVRGADYMFEELQLLQCIAEQVTSVLLNLRLADEVSHARELEAFRTMSAFFVHDLKNTAALLNLMLKNLPVHFNDPAFREDALRGFANMARRIDDTISRLTALRQRPEFRPVETDFNQLVGEALQVLDGVTNVELAKELRPVPPMLADREQIRSVVTNLVLNARDAVAPGGCIRVRTEQIGSSVVLSIADNGCGMTAAFLKHSLFRPFQSTKKKGLGIGMFQSRMIVERHGGNIRVESDAGKGTTVRVSLPVQNAK